MLRHRKIETDPLPGKRGWHGFDQCIHFHVQFHFDQIRIDILVLELWAFGKLFQAIQICASSKNFHWNPTCLIGRPSNRSSISHSTQRPRRCLCENQIGRRMEEGIEAMAWISRQRLRAILHLRCPRCLTGPTFRSLITMYEHCPNCGLLYEREQGFFVGALYVAYGLGIPLLLLAMLMAALAMGRRMTNSFWPAFVLFLPLTPWIFRYSRVIWLHLIQHLDPLKRDSTEL